MQIDGIGGGYEPHSHAHTVSHCVHEDNTDRKKDGRAASKLSQSLSSQENVKTREESVSFLDWAGSLFKGAGRLIGRLWGNGGLGDKESGKSSKRTVISGDESGMERLGIRRDALTEQDSERRMAYLTAQTMMQTQKGSTNQNTGYAGESFESARTLLQKLKYKVQSLSNALAKQFAFSGRQNFNAGTGKGQDMTRRRRSYTHNGVEVDSIQPVENHLMDSYDRKGEYSRISTKR